MADLCLLAAQVLNATQDPDCRHPTVTPPAIAVPLAEAATQASTGRGAIAPDQATVLEFSADSVALEAAKGEAVTPTRRPSGGQIPQLPTSARAIQVTPNPALNPAPNPRLNPAPAPVPKPALNPSASSNSRRTLPSFPPLARPRQVRPTSGRQLYQQRRMALQAGQLYTRLPPSSFQQRWIRASHQPTYTQWRHLLRAEAAAIARGQGSNRLTVVVGDSLSLWLPPDQLSRNQFWLNQGISGDTTRGVLNRLSAFRGTRPTTIHVMAGINDLRRGASDNEVLWNLRRVMQELRRAHPQAQIYIHSILPTRLPSLSNQRIERINRQLQLLTRQEQVQYLDVHTVFSDSQGQLRQELTTDGLHLNQQGYTVWQLAMGENAGSTL